MGGMRDRVLDVVAAEIEALVGESVFKVGVDGVDGAGKTCFADELAERIASVPVIRASVDAFHNPRAVRYARGAGSPEGYFRDSFNYSMLKALLLDPLSEGGSGRYCVAGFDYRRDEPVESPECVAVAPSVLIFDGIFLHRPELRDYWDYSVLLSVSTAESVRRCVARDGDGSQSLDPADALHRRYVKAQRLYLERCHPADLASRVIDNEVIERPGLLPG